LHPCRPMPKFVWGWSQLQKTAMTNDPTVHPLIAVGLVIGAPAEWPTAMRTDPDRRLIKSAEVITLLKLAEHVGHRLGPYVAADEIREKWLAGKIRFWVRWLDIYPQAPGVAAPCREEVAPPEFLRDLERRAIPFRSVISSSEDGIDFGRGKNAHLFASRADAARFWPWDDPYGSKRVTGRKVLPGAPPIYHWEKAYIEAVRYIHENGLPKSQAELVRHMLEWFGEPEPSESQVKEHIGPLYAAFRDASSKPSKRNSTR
jgi:hypothetical protein